MDEFIYVIGTNKHINPDELIIELMVHLVKVLTLALLKSVNKSAK